MNNQYGNDKHIGPSANPINKGIETEDIGIVPCLTASAIATKETTKRITALYTIELFKLIFFITISPFFFESEMLLSC